MGGAGYLVRGMLVDTRKVRRELMPTDWRCECSPPDMVAPRLCCGDYENHEECLEQGSRRGDDRVRLWIAVVGGGPQASSRNLGWQIHYGGSGARDEIGRTMAGAQSGWLERGASHRALRSNQGQRWPPSEDRDSLSVPGSFGQSAGIACGRTLGRSTQERELLREDTPIHPALWPCSFQFFHSLSSCRFPDSVLRRSSSSSLPPTHVVLLADPHVPHPTLSYPSDSNRYLNMLSQAMEELFMRKSWNVVMRLGRVDVVLMLGDMLDWGRGVMTDEE